MTKKMEMEEGLALTREKEKMDQRSKAFDLLANATSTIAFLKDVTISNALTSDRDHIGISPEGEEGLSCILGNIERDMKEAMDLF